ncbi:MAG: DUF3307 domain-containing protein [Prevotella sp.]|nr:DUF3307 domain-containing protein [Prevotella sp.]
MTEQSVALLLALIVCHYLGDFCLTFPAMIRAKADGRKPLPIMAHAAIHALLMVVCFAIAGVSAKGILIAAAIEWVTHFLIDTAKGRLTARFAILSDQGQRPYWMLYGFDQLLHLFVIVGIWWFSN